MARTTTASPDAGVLLTVDSTPDKRRPRTDAEIRAHRLGLLAALPVAILVATARLIRLTWRRLLPLYWATATIAIGWLAPHLGVSWRTVALTVLAAAAAAAGWPARSTVVRGWRAVIVVVLGVDAIATTAAGPTALHAHPTLTVFAPMLAAAVLGWPWWYHLRGLAETAPEPAPAPVDEDLTEYWRRRWQAKVVDQKLCVGTRVVGAHRPRRGVTDLILKLAPGAKPAQLIRTGTDVEVALELDVGAVGWRLTGKAALLRMTIVEKSHISGPVPWAGPSIQGGRAVAGVFADGTRGFWTFFRARFGAVHGLVVGSTGTGKSRGLGVLIAESLHGGFMTVVGDCQGGQSLPAWQDAVSEYHAGVEAVVGLLLRLFYEIKHRSEVLAAARISEFDLDDPRIQALGLRPLVAFFDEVHLMLIAKNLVLRMFAEVVASTGRKTGVGVVMATQIPQLASLGGSQALRDALVAGNLMVLRLSNQGSGATILPASFVGDPFAIVKEHEDGSPTAGIGYLPNSHQIGMLCRVPLMDEEAEAARCPRVPMQWSVPPVDPAVIAAVLAGKNPPGVTVPAAGSPAAGGPVTAAGGGLAGRLRGIFGGQPAPTSAPAPAPVSAAASSRRWILDCLRRAPTSAQALLARPDCPVGQSQLYTLLEQLTSEDRITEPTKRGGPYTLTR